MAARSFSTIGSAVDLLYDYLSVKRTVAGSFPDRGDDIWNYNAQLGFRYTYINIYIT